MSKSTNYEIKTTLAIDGEKAFKAAMDDANRSMRVMNADLKAMAAEYDYTDDKQRFFAQRAELVNEKLKQQDAIVEALNRAVKESGEKYGDASAKTDQYRIRLSDATAKMFELRKESEKAQQELEELGRDSARIGRNIENGIGDAAEDTADKLDSMFGKIAKDVNALKSSVAFQTTMDVGEFVMNGIQSVVGFVQENEEYNRQIAITKYNIEKYGHNWDEALNLIIDAAAITANREGAFEAISNLASSGVQEQGLMEAAVDALLGVFITTGGALSFESLAEDFRASVVSRKPTGTYAEVLEEILQGVVIEDVEKALAEAESVDDAFQVALAYLTEGGFQTTTKSFEEQNQEFLEAQRKQEELAGAWAELALELQPVVTDLTSALTVAVTTVTDWVDWAADVADKYGDTIASLIDMTLEKTIPGYNVATSTAKGIGSLFSGKAQINYDLFNQAYEEYFGKQSPLQSFFEWLIPSAGAETLPTTDLQDYGFKAMQEVANGATSAAEGDSAIYAAVQTILAEADTQALMDQAKTAGTNLMVSYGNGIAAGMDVPLNNVANMVNQINAMLSQISMPAFGLGWSGITGGNVYLYNQQRNAAKVVSTNIGRGAQTKMLMK